MWNVRYRFLILTKIGMYKQIVVMPPILTFNDPVIDFQDICYGQKHMAN